MGVGAGLYMCDVVKKVHVRYLISDEFLLFDAKAGHVNVIGLYLKTGKTQLNIKRSGPNRASYKPYTRNSVVFPLSVTVAAVNGYYDRPGC